MQKKNALSMLFLTKKIWLFQKKAVSLQRKFVENHKKSL